MTIKAILYFTIDLCKIGFPKPYFTSTSSKSMSSGV